MSQNVLTPSLPLVPPVVRAFAEERGIAEYVPPVVEMTREVFPAGLVSISVGEDAELESHKYIALDVKIDGLSTEQLLAAHQAWSTSLSSICSSELGVYFVLGWQCTVSQP